MLAQEDARLLALMLAQDMRFIRIETAKMEKPQRLAVHLITAASPDDPATV